MAQNKLPIALSRKQADSRYAVNQTPFLGQSKKLSQCGQSAVDTSRRYLLVAALNEALYQLFFNGVQSSTDQRLEV